MVFSKNASNKYDLSGRHNLIDALRGLTVISMVAFHFCYDLFMVYGVDPGFYHRPINRVWQQSICISFILISGFVLSFGKNSVRRGITVFIAGGIISAVTLIFMPSEVIIWGVLSFLGASMILTGMVRKWFQGSFVKAGFIGKTAKDFIQKTAANSADEISKDISKYDSGESSKNVGNGAEFQSNYNTFYSLSLFICILLFFVTREVSAGHLLLPGRIIPLPGELYRGALGIMWGFPPPGFRSSDYFPMLPWYFVFLTGYFTSRLDIERLLGADAAAKLRDIARIKVPLLSFIGRKALIIYMIHQPLCMALLWMIFSQRG